MQYPLMVTTSSSGEVGNLPDPASAGSGYQVFLSGVGVGGSYWYSDGTRWRPVGGRLMLYKLQAPVVGVATASDQLLADLRVPAGLLKNGDTLALTIGYGKTGTASESATLKITASPTQGNAAGTAVVTASNAMASGGKSFGAKMELERRTATGLLQIGAGSAAAPFNGASSTNGHRTPVAVGSMDADWYLGLVNLMSGATEVPTLYTFNVEFIASGA